MRIQSVFLIDDDPDIRQVAGMSLSKLGGWEVFMAASGAEALEKVNAINPDVILLDVMMPETDGPSIYLKLRDIEGIAHTPIIFVTAKVQKQEVERYLELGASGCIGKPFNPMTLPQEISEITKDL